MQPKNRFHYSTSKPLSSYVTEEKTRKGLNDIAVETSDSAAAAARCPSNRTWPSIRANDE